MNNLSLQNVAAKSLPAISKSQFTYNVEKNVYLAAGYTSLAGNTYFKAVRLSDRLAVFYDVGIGYCRVFLNGITLFAFNGTRPEVISHKEFNCCFFDERFAVSESVSMLKDFLKGQAKLMGATICDRQLQTYARDMIEETQSKCKKIA